MTDRGMRSTGGNAMPSVPETILKMLDPPIPVSSPLPLADLQAAFQRALMHGDETVILGQIVDSPRADRRSLLAIYRSAYVLRLIGILSSDYACLATYIGEEEMALLARRYIADHPSHSTNARWVGAGLPEHLQTDERYREARPLAEIARIERALNDVFDAADAEPLTLAHLHGLRSEDWPGLVLSPQPSTRRLTLVTNAAEMWRTINLGDESPPPRSLDEPEQLLAYRDGHDVKLRTLDAEQAMMWDEMAKGAAFTQLCELVAAHGGSEGAAARAAGHLQGWIASGLLLAPRP